MGYLNREDAGERLAKALRYFESKDTVVLALPRGGVVLGAEVAKELRAPLGLVLVSKIGHPSFPEYAIGAVAELERPVYNENEILGVSPNWLKSTEHTARQTIQHRRDTYYADDLMLPEVKGKLVILVDDGIATGLTMQAAVLAMRHQHAKRIVVATPVASIDSIHLLEQIADELVVLDNPNEFAGSVGKHYRYFEQLDDEDVILILRDAHPVTSSFDGRQFS